MATKAQGLPLSFIVIAAISALVLVLVVAFTIGGLGGSFKQISITGGAEELSAVQTACSTSCDKSKVTAQTEGQFKSSDYCRRTFTVDLSRNGKVDKGETGLHCWVKDSRLIVDTVQEREARSAIDIPCSFEIGGSTVSEQTCPAFTSQGYNYVAA